MTTSGCHTTQIKENEWQRLRSSKNLIHFTVKKANLIEIRFTSAKLHRRYICEVGSVEAKYILLATLSPKLEILKLNQLTHYRIYSNTHCRRQCNSDTLHNFWNIFMPQKIHCLSLSITHCSNNSPVFSSLVENILRPYTNTKTKLQHHLVEGVPKVVITGLTTF